MEQELINDIKSHADIVKIIGSYIPLTKSGRNFVGKCPFHDDHNPSLTVSPEKQFFKCWVCGTSGTVFAFVQNFEHISFVEAVKKVADMIGYHDERLSFKKKEVTIDKTKEPLYDCLKDLTMFYQYALKTEEGEKGYTYLESRKLDDEVIQHFQIGYAYEDGSKAITFLKSKGHTLKTIEDVGVGAIRGETYYDKNEGRVIFPLWDFEGKVIGYSARIIVEDSSLGKYVNTQETPIFHKSSVLYNYHNVVKSAQIDKYVYVLEGFMDVIALYKAGIKSAVALMGTALTKEHVAMLRKLNVEIRLCLDGDYAGQSNTLKAAKTLIEAGLSFRIVSASKDMKDADVILNSQGAEVLKATLSNLLSFNEFLLNYYNNVEHLTDAKSKKAFIKEILPFLLSVKSQLDLKDYLSKISKITGYDVASLEDLLKRYRYANIEDANKIISTYHPERKAMKKLQMAESEILYQMMHHSMAVDYYSNNIKGFYDEIYRLIANYILEAYQKDDKPDVSSVLTLIETSELDNKDELKDELISLEESIHPKECNQLLLDDYYKTILKEKERMSAQDIQKASFKGKSIEDKARLLNEFNRRKRNNLRREKENENDGEKDKEGP